MAHRNSRRVPNMQERHGRSLSDAYIDTIANTNLNRHSILQHCKSSNDLFQGAADSYEHPAYRDAHADVFAVRVSRQRHALRYGRITKNGDTDLSDRGVGFTKSTEDLP